MRTVTVVFRDLERSIPFQRRDLGIMEERLNEAVNRVFDMDVRSITVKDDNHVTLEHIVPGK